MTAVRKKLTAILVGLVALLAGLSLFVLTGCGKDKAEDLKVTFMCRTIPRTSGNNTAK